VSDRLRQRVEPAALARGREAEGDRDPHVARRAAGTRGAAVAGGEPGARAGGRGGRGGPGGGRGRAVRAGPRPVGSRHAAGSRTIGDEAKIGGHGVVLRFALAVGVVSAVLFGRVPAIQVAGRGILGALKEAGRGNAGGRGQRWLHAALVAGEVALSLMLLVG